MGNIPLLLKGSSHPPHPPLPPRPASLGPGPVAAVAVSAARALCKVHPASLWALAGVKL